MIVTGVDRLTPSFAFGNQKLLPRYANYTSANPYYPKPIWQSSAPPGLVYVLPISEKLSQPSDAALAPSVMQIVS